MTKTERHQQDLVEILSDYSNQKNEANLISYLIANSNLPGPRGNLELAMAFADVVQNSSSHDSETLWRLCSRLIEISANETPTNDPSEFLPFCGAVAIGALASVQQNHFEESM
ncbi:MAG TPA: hypothetical protein VGD14_18590, partial [bacterium]